MVKQITNHKLERQVEHILQYLPTRAELDGQRGGTSFYRKVNDQSYIREFKKTHRNLGGLQDKYELTVEQMVFVNNIKSRLVNDVRQVFATKSDMPANLGSYLENCKAS
jgi:hypothetical protein